VSAPPAPNALASIKAGFAYFGIVFAAGFVFGTVRTLVLAPRIGAVGAVLIELPLMLAVAWFVCRWLVQLFAVGAAWTERLLMGVVAFLLLMIAVLILTIAAFGGTVPGFIAALGTPEGALGLAGQLAFAASPSSCGAKPDSPQNPACENVVGGGEMTASCPRSIW
jgi:hypothetical protein